MASGGRPIRRNVCNTYEPKSANVRSTRDHGSAVGSLLGIDPQFGYQPVHAEGRKLYDQICDAVHDYLLACVRETPALVLVEDMHWFDEDTAEVVRSLLDADLKGHVVVVMTSREQVLPDSSQAAVFHLNPLADDEVDELIVALHPDVTPEQLQAVRRRCDGVPLYIEEVVAKLKEQPTDQSTVVGVPDTLYEALYARLRSSSNAIRVAEAAAIIGSRVERSLLLAVVDLDEHEVAQVIQQLVHGRVLESLDQDSWRFHHELLREVAAELSPPSLRRELHSRTADALVSAAADGNPDWPLIARHYERAERYIEAASSYAQASANARQRGALREALTYLSYAVSQVERSTTGPHRDRLEITLRLGRAFFAQAAEGVFSSNAAADFERCLQLCSSDLQDDDLLSTVMSLYPYYTMHADLDRAQRLVESIRGSLTGPREKFMPVNDFAFGMLAWYRGEFGYARTKMETASQTLTEEGAQALDAMLFMPNDPTAGLFTHLALSRCLDGDLAGVDDELRRTERRCDQLSFPKGAFSLAYARQIEVLIRIEAGELERAAEVAFELGTLGEQHGFDSWELTGAAQHATVGALIALADNAGDAAALAPHIATLTAFVDTWRAVGVIALITFYDALLARLLTAAGQLEEARARLQTGLDLAHQTTMHFYDAELTRLRAFTTDAGAAPKLTTSARLSSWPAARMRGSSNYALLPTFSNYSASPPGRNSRTRSAVFLVTAPGRTRCAPERCSGEAPWREGRHPRWRYGGTECGLAVERARLARSIRIHHRLSTRLAAGRQGGVKPRQERQDRGTRTACLARVVRERLRAASRVLRRTR